MKKVKPYLTSIGLLIVVSGAGEFIHRRFEPANLVMLYLLAVVIAASFWGRGPAVFTSFFGVLLFDFLFIPPRFTLSVDDAQYILTFAALFIVGLVISELTAKTRERLMETSRRQAQIELLKAKQKLQTAVLNSLSHDMRTPLVSITGALSSLLGNDQISKEAERELLSAAFSESMRLNRIVESLLDMTRIEAGALELCRRSCEVRDVIGVALEQIKETLEGRDIRMDIPRDVSEAVMDFGLMAKVIANVVDNAVKYSDEKTPVYISVSSQTDCIRICIRDEGCGIPAKDLPYIFHKFYRGERSQKIRGTGLGLSICKGIVDAHKGKILVHSEEGKGTAVIIELALDGNQEDAFGEEKV